MEREVETEREVERDKEEDREVEREEDREVEREEDRGKRGRTVMDNRHSKTHVDLQTLPL